VLFWPITAKTCSGDLKFFGSIAKGHEAQDPQKDTNSFSADIFDSSHINGLTVITKPVAKVDLIRLAQESHGLPALAYSLYIKLREFLATSGTSHQNCEKSILNIAMTPVLALDPRSGSYITGTKCMS
jgi:hypothetical protein